MPQKPSLQDACKSAMAGDTQEDQFVREVALVLAQAPPPHKMTWADIKQQLSVKPVSPYAGNLQACQYLEVEVLPNVPSRVSTVRLQVDALSKASKPDAPQPQAPDPSGDALQPTATQPTMQPVATQPTVQPAATQPTVQPEVTQPTDNALQPPASKPAAAGPSSSMAPISAQLAQACSAIRDGDLAARIQCMAELLASIGPPHQLPFTDILKHVKNVTGLVKEVRLFKYFKIEYVRNRTEKGFPQAVQLLLNAVLADADAAGLLPPGYTPPVAGQAGLVPAKRSIKVGPKQPPAKKARVSRGKPAHQANYPPHQTAPQAHRAALVQSRVDAPAAGFVSNADTQSFSVQGQVFQLAFSPAGQPIYTAQAGATQAAVGPPSPQPGPSAPATEHVTGGAEAAAILDLLPPSVKSACAGLGALDLLMEVVLDVGRPPVLKLQGAKPVVLKDVGPVDLQEAVHCLMAAHNMPGSSHPRHTALHGGLATVKPAIAPHGLFGPDSRLGIPGTLHRISAIRARDGSITGLTYRVGRHLPGMADMLSDVMHKVAQTMEVPRVSLNSIVGGGPSLPKPTSILVLGRPGLGKTTLLRDIARVLADEFELAVVVVDSSLEIGGAATVPHPALGAARRMEVRDRFSQQDVLIEAVQNHAPQVVVIDEIGTAKEVEAVKTIAQRGVAMVATAHGTDLMSIISNPVLAPLLGGVKDQTIGDEAASNRGGVKTQLQRTGPACFTCLVELLDADTYRVHHNLEESVDMLLVDVAMKRAATSPAALLNNWQGRRQAVVPHTEIRQRQAAGQPVLTVFETQEAAARAGIFRAQAAAQEVDGYLL